MGFDWTAMSYQEKHVGSQAIYVFGLAVLHGLPGPGRAVRKLDDAGRGDPGRAAGPLGTVAAVAVRGMDNNIYTQIGIVLIIALASKNAILIVEFARELRAEGPSDHGAAVGRPAAVPADPDDLVRVHPGHRAAGERHGRRRRQPPSAWGRPSSAA